MKILSATIVAVSALALAACEPEAQRPASPAAAAPPANVQQGFGTSQEDRFVTQRGGSSEAVRNPVATGRDAGGITRQGTGSGTAGTRRNVQMRPDGGGAQAVDRGPGVGAPAPGQPRQ